MKKYQFEIEGREYDVVVESFESDRAAVRVDGTLYNVQVQSETAKASQPASRSRDISAEGGESSSGQPSVVTGPPEPQASPAPSGGGGVVAAPMPGLITAVLVSQGDSVSAGQTLLRMEAMKMENEIPSPIDGVVKEVKVSEGDEVQENHVMVIVEGSE